ncbi:MAG: hypothetical protein HC773_00875 [Scytonema sp. CRU_2_7]|nr:hypothetical protein [Scytonema sp. CRU_2_7]
MKKNSIQSKKRYLHQRLTGLTRQTGVNEPLTKAERALKRSARDEGISIVTFMDSVTTCAWVPCDRFFCRTGTDGTGEVTTNGQAVGSKIVGHNPSTFSTETQVTAGKRPTWDSTNDCLQFTKASENFLQGTQVLDVYDCFATFVVDVPTGTGILFYNSVQTNPGFVNWGIGIGLSDLNNSGNNFLAVVAGGGFLVQSGTPPVFANRKCLIGFRRNRVSTTENSFLYVDRVVAGSFPLTITPASIVTTGGYQLGGLVRSTGVAPDRHVTGKIYGGFLFNGNPSDELRARTERWLQYYYSLLS